jgi:hypothetical protein
MKKEQTGTGRVRAPRSGCKWQMPPLSWRGLIPYWQQPLHAHINRTAQSTNSTSSAFFSQSCPLHVGPTAFGDVFLAVDRPHMRRVSFAIRAPDPKLPFVRIDPVPQLFV